MAIVLIPDTLPEDPAWCDLSDREFRVRFTDLLRTEAERVRAKNRPARRVNRQRRRARHQGAAGVATRTQMEARWAYFAGRCWMCGGVASGWDHVKPLSRGGSNWPSNLRPACRSCNSRKGAQWPASVR